MIKEQAKELMQKIDFPESAQQELLLVLDKLLSTTVFSDIVKRYDSDDYDFEQMVEDTKTLAESMGICVKTAHMLLFICMAPMLLYRYNQKGIDSKIFYDTMRDLSFKLEECRLVHGIYGTMTTAWYKRFFNLNIFALGRLQFEINRTWFNCDVNGVHIPEGTKVLSVHIPRTGTRLDHNLALDSYNRAKEFFKNEFNGDIIFICNSWLLYPWNRTVFKDGSNLAQFYDDFTIVSSGDYDNYGECWRLFDCLYNGDPDSLPSDTSLRRAYIKRIKNGEPTGHGTGVII